MPAMCTTMTPQGLAVTEDYVFISAYCHAKKHNSVIYMINKESHRFIKKLFCPDSHMLAVWHMTVNTGFCGILQIRRNLPRQ